jgi:hypothetical protein
LKAALQLELKLFFVNIDGLIIDQVLNVLLDLVKRH